MAYIRNPYSSMRRQSSSVHKRGSVASLYGKTLPGPELTAAQTSLCKGRRCAVWGVDSGHNFRRGSAPSIYNLSPLRSPSPTPLRSNLGWPMGASIPVVWSELMSVVYLLLPHLNLICHPTSIEPRLTRLLFISQIFAPWTGIFSLDL